MTKAEKITRLLTERDRMNKAPRHYADLLAPDGYVIATGQEIHDSLIRLLCDLDSQLARLDPRKYSR